MRIKILGSGATQPIPRPCCFCKVCEEARKKGIPYSRGGCSVFIYDENLLIDTPPDIANSLNRENIKKISKTVYTHHHPDHTAGAKIFEMINMDWTKSRPKGVIDVFLPEETRKRIAKQTDEIEYSAKRGLIKIHEMKKGAKIGSLLFQPFITDPEQRTYGFVITQGKGKLESFPISHFPKCAWQGLESTSQSAHGMNLKTNDCQSAEQKHALDGNNVGKKKLVYAPCDNHIFPEKLIRNADLAIVYCGYIDKKRSGPEAQLSDILSEVRKANVKRIIVTHIEENRQLSFSGLKKLGKKLGVEFAYDGMDIIV